MDLWLSPSQRSIRSGSGHSAPTGGALMTLLATISVGPDPSSSYYRTLDSSSFFFRSTAGWPKKPLRAAAEPAVASSTGLIIRAKRVEFRTNSRSIGTGVIASAALSKAVASGIPLCLCASWEERSMPECSSC